MTTTARQPKPTKKSAAEPARRPAWTGARASPTFSAASPPPRSANTPGSSTQGTFPSLPAQSNGSRTDNPQDRVLQSLSGLTGTTITLLTKTSQRYEGVILSTNGEGNTTGVTLKDVKEISSPGAPLKDQFFIASTNISSWTSGPADSKMPNGDSFRTDTDISHKSAPRRERDLQAWHSDAPDTPGESIAQGGGDDDTFGPGSTNMSWDQFKANEEMFGVKVGFDEDAYTTKLDRTASDFKERERKAQRLANEITGAGTSNSHIAEERNQTVDDSGLDEEDKYGAVVRGKDAYVPPGARRFPGSPPGGVAEIPKLSVNAPDGASIPPNRTQSPMSSKGASPAPSSSNKPPADPLPAFRDFVTNEKQKLTQKRQALVKSEMDKRMSELIQFSQSFKLNKPIPDDLVPILAKDADKQKQIREKSTKDASSTQARNIGAAATANLAPGLRAAPPTASKVSANSERKPSAPDGKQANAAAAANVAPKSKTSNASAASKTGTEKSSMIIQAIPPFRGSKPTRPTASASAHPPATAPIRANNSGMSSRTTVQAIPAFVPTAANHSAGTMSPTSAANNKSLNVNASSFRPTTKTSSSSSKPSPNITPSASASVSPRPRVEAGQNAPNPFFGTRPLKKNTPIHIRDDFNPFKSDVPVPNATTISPNWPYTGKRYSTMFPPPQHQPPQQHSPHMSAPGPPPMPPPSYEEDSAAQAAARGYVYAYPPYGYPGAPMMPGMPPPGPPGTYMPGPYMQHMPYPPGMPPPNGYPMYAPNMGQMPPPQAYMQAPPGQYPPPNGGGPRQSMPPTPIPSHAHPYYHQSPQMQHAMAYPIMMPPPGQQQQQQHGYDNGQAQQPVQMGGHP